MARMNDEQLQAFLSGDLLCRLGCLDDDGYPYVIPCWFQYSEGGFYLVPRARSAWAGYLQRRKQLSLCIDHEDGDRVLVKGIAELVEEPNVGGRWVPIAREMAARYRGEAGLAYLEQTLQEPRWLFFVHTQRLISWQGRGSWAKKYKHYDW